MNKRIKRPHNFKNKVYLNHLKIAKTHLTWWRFCDYVNRKLREALDKLDYVYKKE